MADLVAELIWVKNLMSELQFPPKEVPMVYCDNLSAVLLAANPILHSKSKHFEIDLYFVRDLVNSKDIRVSHIPGTMQVADILTKAVSSDNFLHFRTKLNIEELDSTAAEMKGKKLGMESSGVDYSKTYARSKYYDEAKPWNERYDAAFACASQNEIEQFDAINLVNASCRLLVEGSNMPCTPEVADFLKKASVLIAPAMATGIGGVVAGELELNHECSLIHWSPEDFESKLQVF
ncbi:uncharacterized protein [Arachis hypogaea]|uniref:uncharacterized protein n=1 Tax=Arachis hypogaea TaxID=3818 RepID=UPI000DEC9781|nr:uncharacterized protein LOC112709317 [Arachis hypogaea]